MRECIDIIISVDQQTFDALLERTGYEHKQSACGEVTLEGLAAADTKIIYVLDDYADNRHAFSPSGNQYAR